MKEEIILLAKDRGLDIAEETVEGLCHLVVDILKLLAKDNLVIAGLLSAVEPTIREAIDKIDIDKDGK